MHEDTPTKSQVVLSPINEPNKHLNLSPEYHETIDGDKAAHPAENAVETNPTPQDNEDRFARFSPVRKRAIAAVLWLYAVVSQTSLTISYPATPEIAATYHTTGTIIGVLNALYVVSMSLAPLACSPTADIFGRRWVFLICGAGFTVFSIGSALAPNLAAFFIFRMLTALPGSAVLVLGSVVIGDIYSPATRGGALGWFLSGMQVGPTFAPVIGGAIVTYTSWRVIFWFQTGLAGLSLILLVILLPETAHSRKIHALESKTCWQQLLTCVHLMNPKELLALLFTRNLGFTALAVSTIVWNQFSILTPIRYVINPRFHLTTPLQGSLFFIPAGVGMLFGTIVGGPWANFTFRRHLAKRGRIVAEDRLNGILALLGLLYPAFLLLYGWGVEKEVGGIPLIVISMFLQGASQLICMTTLNTYAVDVMEGTGKSSLAVGGNYAARYTFSAIGTGLCLPAIQAIGVGWYTTLSALLLCPAAGLMFLLTRYGEKWRFNRPLGWEPYMAGE